MTKEKIAKLFSLHIGKLYALSDKKIKLLELIILKRNEVGLTDLSGCNLTLYYEGYTGLKKTSIRNALRVLKISGIIETGPIRATVSLKTPLFPEGDFLTDLSSRKFIDPVAVSTFETNNIGIQKQQVRIVERSTAYTN